MARTVCPDAGRQHAVTRPHQNQQQTHAVDTADQQTTRRPTNQPDHPPASSSAGQGACLILPGSIPSYKYGPAGENTMLNFFQSAQPELGEMEREEEYLQDDNEFNYLLYNYMFMMSVNKELAISGFHQRMQDQLLTLAPAVSHSVKQF